MSAGPPDHSDGGIAGRPGVGGQVRVPHLSGSGVFIHDSVRVPEDEAWELATALKRRSDRLVLISNRVNLDSTTG